MMGLYYVRLSDYAAYVVAKDFRSAIDAFMSSYRERANSVIKNPCNVLHDDWYADPDEVKKVADSVILPEVR